jgi:hypothetical protein
MIYRGQCHCKAIGYSYRTEVAPERWPVRACQCSFCQAHGARMTSDPSGLVEFHAKDAALLHRYRFGQRTADFLICGACGTYIGAAIETEKGSFAVVNLNVLHPSPAGLSAPQPMSYDGEGIEERTRRREERWTPSKRYRKALD